LKRTNSGVIGRKLLEFPNGLLGLGTVTTSALPQILGILNWRMQEVKKPLKQVLRADPAWSVNSGKIETNPGDIPNPKCLRALAIFSGVKGLEILSLPQVFGLSIGRTFLC